MEISNLVVWLKCILAYYLKRPSSKIFMSDSNGFNKLCFSCECLSVRDEPYSDPWAGIAKNRLMAGDRKEQIINLIAREPKTISQLAKELKIAPPSVHAHINEMLTSELVRDSEEWEKLHPKERYYEPNFPVISKADREEFEEICREMSGRVAEIFDSARPQFVEAFNRTNFTERGWEFDDLTQYLYACIQRSARRLLEERGSVQPAENHKNDVKWVFWAEEPDTSNQPKS